MWTPNYEEVKRINKIKCMKKSDHSLSSYTNHVVYCKYNSIFYFRLHSSFSHITATAIIVLQFLLFAIK